MAAPLFLACQRGHAPLVEALLAARADPNAARAHGAAAPP